MIPIVECALPVEWYHSADQVSRVDTPPAEWNDVIVGDGVGAPSAGWNSGVTQHQKRRQTFWLERHHLLTRICATRDLVDGETHPSRRVELAIGVRGGR